MKNLEKKNFPEVYEYNSFLKFITIISSLIFLTLYFLITFDAFKIIFSDGDEKGLSIAVIIFFVIILLGVIFSILSVFKEKIVLYKDKIVYEKMFSKEELYFSDIIGYKKVIVETTSRSINFKYRVLVSKDNREIKLIKGFGNGNKLFEFIENNFKNLDK